MVAPDKLIPALFAIHSILVKARALAAEDAPHQELFKLMDWAELLPALLARPDDTCQEFRDSLVGIGEDFPSCSGFVKNYDLGLSWFVSPTKNAG